jgi:hypothetical protein
MFFTLFLYQRRVALMIKNAKKNEKKKQPAAFEPCASQFQTFP